VSLVIPQRTLRGGTPRHIMIRSLFVEHDPARRAAGEEASQDQAERRNEVARIRVDTASQGATEEARPKVGIVGAGG
jgi:hypothetical protein